MQIIHNKYRLVINNSDLTYEQVVQLTQVLPYPPAPTHSWHINKHIVAITEFYCTLKFLVIFRFLLFLAWESVLRWLVLSVFSQVTQKMQNIHPITIALSRSSHNIVRKLAYLGAKMTSFDQKHKNVMKVANIGVSKLRISFKGIRLSGKLPISV